MYNYFIFSSMCKVIVRIFW